MTLKPWAWGGLGLCGAGVGTLVGVAFVDLGKADQIASVAGGSVGLIGLLLAAIAQFGGSSTPAAPALTPPTRGVDASGAGAIAAGGNIGSASTGGASVAPPVPTPAPVPAPVTPADSVTASGQGAIAAGGNIGTAAANAPAVSAAPPQNPPTPSPSGAPGPGAGVTASGHGAIAAGGDIGSASTGT